MNTFKLYNILLFYIVIVYFINVSDASWLDKIFGDDYSVSVSVKNKYCEPRLSCNNRNDENAYWQETSIICLKTYNPAPVCDIYTSKCFDGYYSKSGIGKDAFKPFFVQHNFTLDTAWKSVGKKAHCKKGACSLEYTMKIDKSTQIEYGSEKSSTRSTTVGHTESFSTTISASASAGFSVKGIDLGGSIETSEQRGSERSFEVTDENGFTVSYSTSTANTVGFEEKLTCHGVENETIFIEARTNMTRMTGNYCEHDGSLECFDKIYFKCNYVVLKMYPVHNEQISTEWACNRKF